MEQVIIAPGWPDTGNETKYITLRNTFEELDCVVSIIRFDWSQNRVSVLVDQIHQEIDPSCKSLTLLGFSMGAMASLIISTEVPIKKLIICSASGYFNEYSRLLSPEDLEWTNQNMTDFGRYSTADIFNQFKVERAQVFAGDQELIDWPDFKQWMDDLTEATTWPLRVIPHTGHDIGAPEYQKELVNFIKSSHSHP